MAQLQSKINAKPGQQPLISINEQVSLSDSEKQQIDAALSHVSQASGASSRTSLGGISIEALKIVQQHRGWVSDGALNAISDYTKIPVADLDSVATFYNLIFRKPVGKVVLHPCDGISCDLMGGKEVRNYICRTLKIGNAQTTDDNQFTLIPLPCLGACDKAPVMIAAQKLYENLNIANVVLALNQLREQNP